MNNVSIIILTFNKLEYTRQCIESIRTFTKEGTYEIIVVDNASTDETVKWLREQPDLKVIENSVNRGFPCGCNQGVAIANPDNDVLLLNNDTILTQNWLENLRICLDSSEKIGAAGAVSVSNANLQGIKEGVIPPEAAKEYGKKNNRSDPAKWEEKIKLIGFCLLVKRIAWEKAGGLDESFSPGYYEDDDFSLRLIQLGFRLMLCHDCFIYHYLGTSFRANRQKFYELLAINQQKFFLKWGFYTTEFDRFDLLTLQQEENQDRKANILEIGCGIGAFLQILSYRYPNATVTGIESENRFERVAKLHSNVILHAKDDDCYPIAKQSVDVIYFNSSMNKVKHLIQILSAMHYYLTENGKLVFRFTFAGGDQTLNTLLRGGTVAESQNGTVVAGKEEIKRIVSQYGYEEIQIKKATNGDEWVVSATAVKDWLPRMNPKKIALITCVNHEEVYQSALKTWHKLTIPYGFEVEFIPIRHAKSMCSAYNQAMHLTDAKYKIYLHQDIFVNEKDLLLRLLAIFSSDEKIGAIGMVGTKQLPDSANWWEGKELRGTIYSEHSGSLVLLNFVKPQGEYEAVQVVDGVMIATQYDLEWKEDMLTGFHFYDVTQCLEFGKMGYQVVVPRQEEAWLTHRCGLKNNVEDFQYYEDLRHWMRENYLKETLGGKV